MKLEISNLPSVTRAVMQHLAILALDIFGFWAL